MPEIPSPHTEKNRRSRSFGTFLLVLLVLLVVMALVGKNRYTPPEELTQDQFEWYLNKGDVVSLKFNGGEKATNLITGTFNKPGEGRHPFEVKYSSLDGDREQRFQQLKAIRSYRDIEASELLRGMAANVFHAREARLLSAFTVARPPQPAESGQSEVSLTAPHVSEPQREDCLLVEVDAAARGTGGLNVERLELPDLSGPMWFSVRLDRGDDLAVVLAQIEESSGISVARRTFDLTPEEGTRWIDSTSIWSSLLIYLAPWLLILVVAMIFMRQLRAQGGAGGVMSFGRSRAQLYTKENRTNLTFNDVAGAEEAKAEVRELVEFLKNPSRFTRVGGRIPRGVLLVGPPGCGKTLLAKAIAGEAEVPFFSISGSDFVEMFVGVGASRVRDLFKQARENSPCIIFLDEIDAVGRRRGSGMGGGHDEREQTLNAILVEMDGFSTDEGIIVIAATNRPDVLDPALLRPGRFDREVVIDLPDVEGRRAILGVHMKKVKHEPVVDLDVLARSTPGYSGADLAAIVNEAAIAAVLAKREAVSMADLDEARDKVRYGRQKKSRKLEEEDRRITAYHEAGHAVVAASLPEYDRPHKVTIVPRGRALGTTMILPERESYHMQRKKILATLTWAFGGRAAEAIFCGDVSAGAADDIRRATDLARAMVTELGMSERVGPINYSERQGSDFLGTELMRGKLHSETTAREIDEEVERILRDAYAHAESLIRSHRDVLERVAQALLAYETLNGDEILRLFEGSSVAGLRPAPETPGDSAPSAPRKPAAGETPRVGEAGRGELGGSPGLSPA
jgi:cell division protease FtsH